MVRTPLACSFTNYAARRRRAYRSSLDHVQYRILRLGLRFRLRLFAPTKFTKSQQEVSRVRSIRQSVFLINDATANHFFEHAIECLHPFDLALFHRVRERLAFLLAAFDALARARLCFQNFDRCNAAAAIGARQETLRDDVTEGSCEPSTNDLLFVFRKDTDDALDSFRRVDRVQRRERSEEHTFELQS